MGSISLPSPPAEDHHHKPTKKSSSHSSSKVSKSSSAHRSSTKRTNSHPVSATSSRSSHAHDEKQRRVWKACERCRMKKTKCDGEIPCKRCNDDGLTCTAGARRKIEYKQIPKGYAEVLESTQFALVATIHKLYGMVRNGETWDLGEPGVNERGLPIVHNIASQLGCIRPHSDLDLPVHSVFPEDESDMVDLARKLEEHQREVDSQKESDGNHSQGSDHSDHDHDHDYDHDTEHETSAPSSTFSGSTLTMSPSSVGGMSTDFDLSPVQQQQPELDLAMFPNMPNMPNMPNVSYSTWKSPALALQYFQQANPGMDMLGPAYIEAEFGAFQSTLTSTPNSQVMMGMSDPMIYGGYDGEPMRM